MDPKEQIEQGLRVVFEASLPERVGRKGRVKSHPIIPGHYFASASMECRDLFVAGSFSGCISLVQAVAEAVSRFVAKVNANPSVGDPVERVRILQKRGFLSEPIKNAFESIWRDRNEFHHMNPNVEIDKNRLEGRAERIR